MREASSKRDCPSVRLCVRLCVTLSLQICNMQKNTREKVHIVSAREISTFLMREASSKRDCPSVRLYVCMYVCMYVTFPLGGGHH